MEVVPQPTLGHIFNMDKAEHIFAQLLQHIARQDAELRALRERLDATPDASTLHDALSAARAERLRLERRLDAIEFSTRTPDDAAPIGESMAQAQRAIARLADGVGASAPRADLAAAEARAAAALDDATRATREACASRELGERLDSTQTDLILQLEANTKALACKVDTTHLHSIEATRARLEAFRAFMDDAEAALADHGARLDANETADADARASAEATRERAEHAAVTAEAATPGEAHAALVARVDELAAAAEAAGSAEEVAALRAEVRARGEQLDELEGMHCAHADAIAARVAGLEEGVQASAASTADGAGRQMAALEARLRDELASGLEARAPRSAHLALAREVTALRTRAEQAEARLAVAMRFVDWFANRGDAYEANLSAVDRALENVARQVDPSARGSDLSGGARDVHGLPSSAVADGRVQYALGRAG